MLKILNNIFIVQIERKLIKNLAICKHLSNNFAFFSWTAIICCLILCSTEVQALSKQENPWSVGIHFSPNYCYRKIHSTRTNADMRQLIYHYNSTEIASAGYNTGINLRYKFHNSFYYESGLTYSHYSFQTKPYPITSYSNPDGDNTKIRFIYHFKYLEIPLRVIYIGSSAKNNFSFSCGIINQFGIEQYNIERIEKDNKVLESNRSKNGYDFNPNLYNISAMISAGYIFRKSKKISIHIEPSYRHQLLTYNKGSILKENLFNLGVQIGVYYRME